MHSKQKGARGEREFAEFLRDRGIEAGRGQQFSGGEAVRMWSTASPKSISK